MIEQEKQEKSSDNAWLRPVMIFYAKVTSWIIVPLVIAVLLGKYASASLGSQVLFFIAVIIGFLITCFGIYRELKEYKNTLDKIDNQNGHK
ncbi:MAG: hypothetical protein M3Q34_00995 [bacterium]|nr:hypothetical protein [bacterium]